MRRDSQAHDQLVALADTGEVHPAPGQREERLVDAHLGGRSRRRLLWRPTDHHSTEHRCLAFKRKGHALFCLHFGHGVLPVIIVAPAKPFNLQPEAVCALVQGVHGEQCERFLLGGQAAGVRRILAQFGGETFDHVQHVRFGGERQDGGLVAQRRLVIVAGIVVAERLFGRLEGGGRPGPVPQHGETGPNMGTRQRALDRLQLAVMQITQPGNVCLARLGQHIERIGGRALHQLLCRVVGIAALIDIRVIPIDAPGIAGRDRPQGPIGPLQRLIRHGIAGLLRPIDKVRDIGPEPRGGIAVPFPPQAEGAIRALTVQQRVYRRLDTRLRIVAAFRRAHGDQLLGIEQGQGPAGRLFGTPIRIAVERGVKRRRVHWQGRIADTDRGRARHEPVQQICADRVGIARLHQLPADLGHGQVRRAGLDLVGPVRLEIARSTDGQTDCCDPFGFGVDANGHVCTDPCRERPRQLSICDIHRAIGRDFGRELARSQFDIVDAGRKLGLIARRKEARHDEVRRRLLAHDHAGLG